MQSLATLLKTDAVPGAAASPPPPEKPSAASRWPSSPPLPANDRSMRAGRVLRAVGGREAEA
eukprot:2862508-Rhodomonas_salina.4